MFPSGTDTRLNRVTYPLSYPTFYHSFMYSEMVTLTHFTPFLGEFPLV